MTTRTLLSAMVLGCTLGLASTANAMPLMASPAMDAPPTVTLVVGGCGMGGHRGYRGFCRPNLYRPAYRAPLVYGAPRVYGAPLVYGARRCVVRPGVYGPRRICY